MSERYEVALAAWKKHGGPRPKLRPDGIPTRIDLNWLTAPELAIRGAMLVVEKADGSQALTAALTLLGRACDRAADHAEDVQPDDLDKAFDDLCARITAKPGEKVTKEAMEIRIHEVTYHRIGETVTLCSILLDNGYSVRGESACVDPANYDKAIGERLAYDDAFRKLWPLFGFLLAEKRFQGRSAT